MMVVLDENDLLLTTIMPNVDSDSRTGRISIALNSNPKTILADVEVRQSGRVGFATVDIGNNKTIDVLEDWPLQFPEFDQKFGNNLSSALTKPTGKRDGAGNEMYVWQDYVAGTDPTDPSSKFMSRIDVIAGAPIITWSPNLNTNGIARNYTVLGKSALEDGDQWAPTNSFHRFFKVEVGLPK